MGVLWALGAYHVTRTSISAAILSALGAAIFAGFVEELLMRGIVFRQVEEVLGTWSSLLLSAVLFGAMHAQPERGRLEHHGHRAGGGRADATAVARGRPARRVELCAVSLVEERALRMVVAVQGVPLDVELAPYAADAFLINTPPFRGLPVEFSADAGGTNLLMQGQVLGQRPAQQ